MRLPPSDDQHDDAHLGEQDPRLVISGQWPLPTVLPGRRAELPVGVVPADVCALLTGVRDAALVRTRIGAGQWSNPAFKALIASHAVDPELITTMQQLADLLAASIEPVGSFAPADDAAASTETLTADGRFALWTSYLRAYDVVVVTAALRTRDALPAGDDALRELCAQYGLTERETDVALLLVDGCTNNDVAERLTVSPHTARHHTERVLSKLGIRNRAGVAALLRPR